MNITVPEWFLWNNPKFPDTKAVNVFDHKDGECLAYVFDDGGRVHFAIRLGEHVIAFEHIPENYPATSIAFYTSVQMWKKAIIEVDWIVAGLKEGHPGIPECDIEDL
jgi:hypothetical protein